MNKAPNSVYCEIDFPQHPTISVDERIKLAFHSPSRIHMAYLLTEVKVVLASVEAARARGHWCVGFVSHEAAGAFDTALVVKSNSAKPAPLAWFAEFDRVDNIRDYAPTEFSLGQWQTDTDAAAFADAVEAIRADIHAGRFYQVNYTTRLETTFAGDALSFYRALQAAQPNGYHLFIDAGEFQLLSVSPELFFAVRDNVITTQPMKGTAPRGDTASEDAAIAEALTHSPKERAENLMIVDLLRNDLSRIAEANSVEVPHLFSLHPLPSVWQMTSTVRATMSSDKTLTDIFSALFPCGSVTGAPKVEAMKAIAALEHQPRGVYCGALGYVAPDGVAAFNVGIRSVWIAGGHATCGIGSGITYDSTVEGEAAEVAYKARFVVRASKPFTLFETMRLEDGEIRLLPRHLARLENSARHFRFDVNRELLKTSKNCRPGEGRGLIFFTHQQLTKLDPGLRREDTGFLEVPNSESLYSAAIFSLNAVKNSAPIGVWRVKLTLNHHGECRAECFPLDATPAAPTIQFANAPISRHDEFLQHKTSRRETYQQHAPPDGVWDTLLFNQENEITEFIRANIVLDIGGKRVTPPLACGLLNGTLREQLLAEGVIQERVLFREDVEKADKIWWVNGLRGEVLVRIGG